MRLCYDYCVCLNIVLNLAEEIGLLTYERDGSYIPVVIRLSQVRKARAGL